MKYNFNTPQTKNFNILIDKIAEKSRASSFIQHMLIRRAWMKNKKMRRGKMRVWQHKEDSGGVWQGVAWEEIEDKRKNRQCGFKKKKNKYIYIYIVKV